MGDLAIIESFQALTPAVVFAPGGVEALISKLEAEVRAIDTDISTPTGRSAIKSLANKVARSKTALDDMGKDLVSDLKKQTGAIDAERRTIRDRLDALKDEVRKPLTDWENAEKDRVSGHEIAIGELVTLGLFIAEPDTLQISDRLAQLAAMPPRDWQEFKFRADKARSEAFATLTILKDRALARETEAAELVRLRAEQVAREQKEREDRIAAEAADKARIVAEAQAARDAKEAADKAATERQQVEAAEAAAVARAEKAERDAKAAVERAERDRVTAEAKAELDRVTAIDDERRRVAAIKAVEDAATLKRESDRAHKKRINSEVLEALTSLGLSTAQGVAVVTAIVKGEIPHTRIQY